MYSIGKNIGILNCWFNIFLNRELAGVGLNATEFMYIGQLYQNDGIMQDELAEIHQCRRRSAGRAETAGDRGYRFIDGQLDQKDQLESGGRISILYYGKFNSKKKNEQT